MALFCHVLWYISVNLFHFVCRVFVRQCWPPVTWYPVSRPSIQWVWWQQPPPPHRATMTTTRMWSCSLLHFRFICCFGNRDKGNNSNNDLFCVCQDLGPIYCSHLLLHLHPRSPPCWPSRNDASRRLASLASDSGMTFINFSKNHSSTSANFRRWPQSAPVPGPRLCTPPTPLFSDIRMGQSCYHINGTYLSKIGPKC